MTEENKKFIDAGPVPVPLILFSGGLDSTHLLSERLKTTDVEIMYVRGPQGPNKIEMELAAREKIKAYLAKNRQFKIRKDYIYDDSRNGGPADSKFGQILSWFNAALHVSDVRRHTGVEIAYVSGDSICHDLHWIKQGWDNLAYVVKSNRIDLSFPLQWVPKINILKEIDPKLYKHIWVCELPVKKVKYFKACNKCVACITHAGERFKLERLAAIELSDAKRSKRSDRNARVETLLKEKP